MTLEDYQYRLDQIEQSFEAREIDYDTYREMVQQLYDEVY